MRKNILILTVVCIWLIFSSETLAQTTIRARTESGREVILSSDGTWRYAEEPKAPQSVDTKYSKPKTAKKLFKPSRGSFGIWYDESKWKQLPSTIAEGERTHFSLLQGDGYAIVVAEGLPIPIASLKELALENAREADPNVKVLMEEKRVVNGTEVICLKMEGTVKQIPFTYYGYYYGGKQGAIQIITFTAQSVFDKYQQEFTSFLNGLEVYE